MDVKHFVVAELRIIDQHLASPELVVDVKGGGGIEFSPSGNQVDEDSGFLELLAGCIGSHDAHLAVVERDTGRYLFCQLGN